MEKHEKIRVASQFGVPTLEELVRQITPENRYEETKLGAERGHEKTEW